MVSVWSHSRLSNKLRVIFFSSEWLNSSVLFCICHQYLCEWGNQLNMSVTHPKLCIQWILKSEIWAGELEQSEIMRSSLFLYRFIFYHVLFLPPLLSFLSSTLFFSSVILFLPSLLSLILSFILVHRHENVHILDTLVSRINTPFQVWYKPTEKQLWKQASS